MNDLIRFRCDPELRDRITKVILAREHSNMSDFVRESVLDLVRREEIRLNLNLPANNRRAGTLWEAIGQ